jgi:hypothetical protein
MLAAPSTSIPESPPPAWTRIPNAESLPPTKHDPQPNPSKEKSHIHRIPHIPVKQNHTRFFGGAIGAGVPCAVRPKSHMHRNATADPNTDGTVAIHPHGSARAALTRNRNHPISSQNQKESPKPKYSHLHSTELSALAGDCSAGNATRPGNCKENLCKASRT